VSYAVTTLNCDVSAAAEQGQESRWRHGGFRWKWPVRQEVQKVLDRVTDSVGGLYDIRRSMAVEIPRMVEIPAACQLYPHHSQTGFRDLITRL